MVETFPKIFTLVSSGSDITFYLNFIFHPSIVCFCSKNIQRIYILFFKTNTAKYILQLGNI